MWVDHEYCRNRIHRKCFQAFRATRTGSNETVTFQHSAHGIGRRTKFDYQRKEVGLSTNRSTLDLIDFHIEP